MNNEIISVIIPCYNNSKYLLETINSLLKQTYTNWEAVIVDDGSTDETETISLELAKNDSRVKYIKKENGGVSSARNLGIKFAKGEYIQFLDADDLLETYKFQHAISCFNAEDSLDVVVSDALYFTNDNPEKKQYNLFDNTPWMGPLWLEKKSIIEKLCSSNVTPICCPILKRKLLDKVGFFDESFAAIEDWDLWFRCALVGTKFRFKSVKNTFALIRIRQNSLSQNRQNMYIGQLKLVIKHLEQELNPNCKQRLFDLALSSLKEIDKDDNKININKLYIASLEFYNKALAERDNVLAEKDKIIAEKELIIAKRERRIANIKTSISWKITSPLRILNDNLFILYSKVFKKKDSTLKRNYQEWIKLYDTLSSEKIISLKNKILLFNYPPLISVILPCYNTNTIWLKEAIDSVCNQIYPNWELCISDDASTDLEVTKILKEYASKDRRIKVVFREQNGHISKASNSALGLATGEWVALLDHDDILPQHALYEVAKAINENPSARLIYSDEDKIDANGKRCDPYFKCDWNQDLFYSQNVISHLGVYYKSILDDIGGFREGFEGSQDYDLALRYIEKITPDAIHHIPRVLYHWRIHPESTAGGSDAKPYALIAGERAINEHFKRMLIPATAVALKMGYRAKYELPDYKPLVSIIIPTHNNVSLLRKCISSLLEKTDYENYEILVIDNRSDDPQALIYLEKIDELPTIRVLRDPRPFNYSSLNNSAVQEAQGEIICLLNDDIEVINSGWLSEMVSHAIRSTVGAVGAKLLYKNNTVQHAGVVMGILGLAGHAFKGLSHDQYGYFGRAVLIQNYCALTAACLVIEKKIFVDVGGFDEINLTVAFNDVDLCLKLKQKGYQNVWSPYAELYHHESASRGFEDTPEKLERFTTEVNYMKDKWGNMLLNDPAYSPNLTLNSEDFSLAWPPRI